MTVEDTANAPGLAWLEDRVHHEIDLLRHNYQPWVPPTTDENGRPVLDVLIVGGGLYGLGLAWGLIRAKVTNILVVDQAPTGREGPWTTFARMKTLRTAKELTGIEFGIPSLSVRAFWEAKFGQASWQSLSRIPRVEWMTYLEWFRQVLRLPVRNDTEVLSIDGDADLVRVSLRQGGETSVLAARRIVLATGLLGSGGKHVPAGLVEHLTADHWAHAADDIDFSLLKGADVAILGAGASAFDNAITAAEHGARRARLFSRRPELPWLSAKKGLENAGFMRHFADFPDHYRWRFVKAITETPIPPPRHTVERALKLDNFTLRLDSPWLTTRMNDDKVEISTPKGMDTFDFLIFGTGFDMNIDRRPELAALVPHVLRWRHRFSPPKGEENDVLLSQPYLGTACEFQEHERGACPVLERISMLGAAATLSIGPMFGGLNGVKYVLERIVDSTCRALMMENLDTVYANFKNGFQAEKPPGAMGSND